MDPGFGYSESDKNVRQTHCVQLIELCSRSTVFIGQAKDQLICFLGTMQTDVMMALAVGFL